MNKDRKEEKRFLKFYSSGKDDFYKLELMDNHQNDRGRIIFEMWHNDDRILKLYFTSTRAYLEWCEDIKKLGLDKLADESENAKLIWMDSEKYKDKK